jgi:hypothetical protein
MEKLIERCWLEVLASRGGTLHGWKPRTPDEDDPPAPSFIRFDFPPGSTPEEIACILMESLAKHDDDDGDGDDDDA